MTDYSPGSELRKLISAEFMRSKHDEFRNWYFRKFSKEELERFKEEFYSYLEKSGDFQPFITWFVKYIFKQQENEISILQKSWQTIRGEKIFSPFPPEQTIILDGDHNAEATAFLSLQRIESAQVTIREINSLIKSQNYTNTFLVCIGDQFVSLEEKILALTQQVSTLQKELEAQKSQQIAETQRAEESPLIQPPIHIEGFKLETNQETNFVQILENKFKGLNLSVISQAESSKISEEEEILEDPSLESRENINQLAEVFSQINVNPIYHPKPLEKYYYKRPSPQDLLFEESEPIQNSYSGRAIYEWNIDGLNDKQIVDIIHRMFMYSTICTQHNNTDSMIASFITTGFVGQLRGWWDHYLTENQKQEILSHKRIIKNESGIITTEEDDAVYTLTLAILQHFVGKITPLTEKVQTLLQNLRCPSLTHFRWYKDTFLSRVYQLGNSNSIHWKSKFIDGLPHLFAERVRQSLRTQSDGVNIDFPSLTYGQIITSCINEGLTLCNDIKLKNQLKKQSVTEKTPIR